MNNDKKEYLYDTIAEMIYRYGAQNVLEDMCALMSEDNLHEIVAAISAYRDDPYGIDFWYGDRADYVDREFWQNYEND